jgi:hypothetical protein
MNVYNRLVRNGNCSISNRNFRLVRNGGSPFSIIEQGRTLDIENKPEVIPFLIDTTKS